MLDASLTYLVITTRRAAAALQSDGAKTLKFFKHRHEMYGDIFQAESSVVTLAILNNFTQIVFRNFLRDDAHNFAPTDITREIDCSNTVTGSYVYSVE